MNFISRVKQSSRELILFAIAALALGMAFSMFDATFNNFLNDEFALTGFQRSFLEFPRELPWFLVVFVSAALWFLCSRRLGMLAMILSAVGAVLIGFASSSYGVMIVWLFIFSLGQHLFMPIASTIGMESQVRRIDIVFQVGATTESVTVEAGACNSMLTELPQLPPSHSM